MNLCNVCHGNEVVYRFWKNDSDKLLLSDWLYCRQCYPDASGYWPMLDSVWVEITGPEYYQLKLIPYPNNYHDTSH